MIFFSRFVSAPVPMWLGSGAKDHRRFLLGHSPCKEGNHRNLLEVTVRQRGSNPRPARGAVTLATRHIRVSFLSTTRRVGLNGFQPHPHPSAALFADEHSNGFRH